MCVETKYSYLDEMNTHTAIKFHQPIKIALSAPKNVASAKCEKKMKNKDGKEYRQKHTHTRLHTSNVRKKTPKMKCV